MEFWLKKKDAACMQVKEDVACRPVKENDKIIANQIGYGQVIKNV